MYVSSNKTLNNGTMGKQLNVLLDVHRLEQCRYCRLVWPRRCCWRERFGSPLSFQWVSKQMNWLVVWNIFLCLHSVGNFIIPIDYIISFRGVFPQPPPSSETWVGSDISKQIAKVLCTSKSRSGQHTLTYEQWKQNPCWLMMIVDYTTQ